METWLHHSFNLFYKLSVLILISFSLLSCQKGKSKNDYNLETLKPNTIYHMREPKLSETASGCILVTTDLNQKGTLKERVFLIGRKGTIHHSWSFAGRTKFSTIDENGDLWVMINKKENQKSIEPLVTNSWFQKVSKEGQIIWEKEFRGSHHKFSIIDNQRIIFPTFSQKKAKYSNGEILYTDRIVTLNLKSGAIEDEFDLIDIIPKPPYDEFVFRDTKSIHHTNSIEYYEKDPLFGKKSVLISIRSLNKIFLIELESRKILWRSKIDGLHYGHDARFLENGDILFFNNGKVTSEVIQINPLKQSVVWSFKNRFQFHSHIKGAAQRLDNGNTLILQSQKSHIFEVDPLGDVLWSVLFFFPQEERKAWTPVGINMVEHYSKAYLNGKYPCD